VRRCIPKLFLVRDIMRVIRNLLDGMKSVSVMTTNSFHAMEWQQDLLLPTEKDKDKIKRSTLRIAIAKIYGWTMK
jgi:hypothetical protein